jgi:nucleoid-associated protein YgaU
VRGIAYERNKEWPKAEADFKRALELKPDQPQVLNYLGYSWVDQGMNLEPALKMIETAVAAAPNDGYIIDSLGWAFYRLGRYEEAVETLERAVQLRPNDPEINDHLGDAYFHAGRPLEARFQWNVALAMDEDGNVKARVLPKLAAKSPEPATEAVTAETEKAKPVQPAPTQVATAPEPPAKPEPEPEQPAAPVEPEPAVESEPAAETEPATQAEPAAEPEAEPDVETATAPAPAIEPEPAGEASRTVLPGDNLWEIALQVYGKGADYRLIVEANREKLDDPNMIQPGLVLVLPSAP